MAYMWIALGGALGTVARYGLSGLINDRYGPSPLAIFIVNITGAFLIGFVATVTQDRFLISPDLRRFATIGFLGGYTTFSTLTYETMQLIEVGDYLRATANSLGSLLAGMIAVYGGVILGRIV